MYRLEITKHALKEIIVLPTQISTKIVKAIDGLENDPRPKGCKKLKGEKDYLWRIRVGDYRIIYSIEESVKIVEIRKVSHPKNVYTSRNRCFSLTSQRNRNTHLNTGTCFFTKRLLTASILTFDCVGQNCFVRRI